MKKDVMLISLVFQTKATKKMKKKHAICRVSKFFELPMSVYVFVLHEN